MGSLLVQSDCSSLRLVDETLHHQTHVRTVGQTLRPPFLSLVFNIVDTRARGRRPKSAFLAVSTRGRLASSILKTGVQKGMPFVVCSDVKWCKVSSTNRLESCCFLNFRSFKIMITSIVCAPFFAQDKPFSLHDLVCFRCKEFNYKIKRCMDWLNNCVFHMTVEQFGFKTSTP